MKGASMDEIELLNSMYVDAKKPSNIIEGMDYDEFVDWLELGTAEDIKCAMVEFKKDGLSDHVAIMKSFLKKLKKNKIFVG